MVSLLKTNVHVARVISGFVSLTPLPLVFLGCLTFIQMSILYTEYKNMPMSLAYALVFTFVLVICLLREYVNWFSNQLQYFNINHFPLDFTDRSCQSGGEQLQTNGGSSLSYFRSTWVKVNNNYPITSAWAPNTRLVRSIPGLSKGLPPLPLLLPLLLPLPSPSPSPVISSTSPVH